MNNEVIIDYIKYLLATKKSKESLSTLNRLYEDFLLEVDDKIDFDVYLVFLEFFVNDFKND